jgi:2-polyprenyl-6-methoxyphenol hydroxylase-like FAD-dependent oxidoreductase
MHMTHGKRAFFAYAVDDDGEAGWFVNLPHPKPLTQTEARAVGAEEWLSALRAAVADDRTPAPQILDNVDPDQIMIVGGIDDMPTVPTWSKGRIVLIGDSAHAASSSSGQGASMAIESAVQLARCLRDMPNVPQAFAAYERLRRERVERIIATGARNASEKMAGPVSRVLRDLIMPTAMKLLAKPEKMAWQYEYSIDWDAPVEPAGALAGR